MANETLQNPFLPEDENQNPDAAMIGQGTSVIQAQPLTPEESLDLAIASGNIVESDVVPIGQTAPQNQIGQGTVLQEPDNLAIINQTMSQAGVPRLGDKIIGAVNSMQQNQVIDPVAAQQALEEDTGPVDSFFPTEAQQAEYKSTTGPLTTSQYLGSRMGAREGSPQANFLAERAKGPLSPGQIAQAEEFAASIGTTFDPETGYSRDAFVQAQNQGQMSQEEASRQASLTGTPMSGQTLSQFMRYEDQPEQRTEQFVDPQGRLRRRMTPTAAALAGLPAGQQPLAPEYNSFEQAGAMREARIAARPDFNRAVSDRERRGGQLSQADLRDLVQAERPGATVGEQARALEIQQRAGMGEFETKSPEEEELDRARKQASIDFMRAQIAQMTQEPSEAEIAKQELEIKILEQQYKDAGFAPVAVETDPQTGATVQVYRNPEGEERRLFKTGPRSGTRPSTDAFGAIVGGGPAQPSTVVGGGPAQPSTVRGGGPAPIPTITSQEEYDNLEKGAQYRDSRGRLATKKS